MLWNNIVLVGFNLPIRIYVLPSPVDSIRHLGLKIAVINILKHPKFLNQQQCLNHLAGTH